MMIDTAKILEVMHFYRLIKFKRLIRHLKYNLKVFFKKIFKNELPTLSEEISFYQQEAKSTEKEINDLEIYACYNPFRYDQVWDCIEETTIFKEQEQRMVKYLTELKTMKEQIESGELSDGFHTFNDLYYQRMVLFAVLVKAFKDKAWKSYMHEDGELCFGGGWFIVGIDTPEGTYTYHYKNEYWYYFDCKELKVGKHWDGHTDKDVIRLFSLVSSKPKE